MRAVSTRSHMRASSQNALRCSALPILSRKSLSNMRTVRSSAMHPPLLFVVVLEQRVQSDFLHGGHGRPWLWFRLAARHAVEHPAQKPERVNLVVILAG